MFQVFGADWCAPCRNTKKLLESRGLEYEFFPVVEDDSALEKYQEMSGNKNPDTIPQIFHNGNYIGGYNQLETYLEKSN